MLYSHWLRRQAAGLSPFVVLNPGPHHGRALKKSMKAMGKERKKYVDVSTSDEGSEEEGGGGDSTSEGEEEEESDKEEEDGRTARFGPPIGKARAKIPHSTRLHENTVHFAESSTAAQTREEARKMNSKPKTDLSKSDRLANDISSKKTNSKKRKLEEDSGAVSPQKVAKNLGGGKRSRKQPGDEPDSTPAKVRDPSETEILTDLS
jgi:hypothetical protein